MSAARQLISVIERQKIERAETKQAPSTPGSFKSTLEAARAEHVAWQKEMVEDSEKRLQRMEGTTTLTAAVAAARKRVADLERANPNPTGPALLEQEMALNQQLNVQYLAMQDKAQRLGTGLISNLLKLRFDTVRGCISAVH